MRSIRGVQCALSIGLTAAFLQGCGYAAGVGDWAKGITSAWAGEAEDTGALGRILTSAEETPGSQGLLYVATAEAEIAAQATSLAVARIDQPSVLESQMGELIYALDPSAAPDWGAKSTGLVPGWEGLGYGALRASEEMVDELEQLAARGGPVGAAADDALICTTNALERGRRAMALAQEILAGSSMAEVEALLPQIERLTKAMNAGLDQDGDDEIGIAPDECGLLAIEQIMSAARFETA